MNKAGKRSFFPTPMAQADAASRPTQAVPNAKIRSKNSNTVTKNTQSISDMFSTVLQRKGLYLDSPAIYHQRKVKLTYKSLNKISSAMAKNLERIVEASPMGPNGDGDTVVAYIVNDYEEGEKFVTLLLATLKLGITLMPLSTQNEGNDISWALNVVKPSVIINGSDLKESLFDLIQNSEAEVIDMNELWRDSKMNTVSLDNAFDVNEVEFRSEIPKHERIIGIYFTAGSVSSPHAVRIGVKEIFNRMHWQSKVFPTFSADAFALTSCVTDPRSLSQILVPLLAGKPLTIIDHIDQKDPEIFIARIAEVKLTRITITGIILEGLLNYLQLNPNETQKVASITHWIVSGNTLKANTARMFFKVFSGTYKSGVLLITMYGTTEILGEATYEVFFNLEDVQKKMAIGSAILSAGVPITNTSIAIVDSQDNYMCLGQPGEIVVKGVPLASGGYVGQGMGMLSKFKARKGDLKKENERRHMLFRTGDIGRILVDNNGIRRLYIEGRMDNIAKIDGKLVNFKELQGKIMSTEMVKKTVIFTYHRGRDSQVVIAACVLKPGTTCSAVMDKLETLRLRNFIPVLFSVDEIPLTPVGLIDKKRLRALYRNILLNCLEKEWEPLTSFVPAEEIPTAKFLCKAIALSLGSPLVDIVNKIDESYWKIGGTSLNAVMTIKMCRDNGYPISTQDFILATALTELVSILYTSIGNKPLLEPFLQNEELDEKYSFDFMTPEDEDQVILLMKNDFQPNTNHDGAIQFWRALINNVRHKRLCLVAKQHDTNGGSKVVGVIVTGDASEKMKLPKPPAEISYGLELVDTCFMASKHQMWRKSSGRIARAMFVGVKGQMLTNGEKTLIVQELLARTSWLIKASNFSSIVIATTNPLVQEVATHLLDFENLMEFPVARFRATDKSRPFSNADDNHTASVLIKSASADSRGKRRLSRAGSRGSMSKVQSSILSTAAISTKESSTIQSATPTSNY